MLVTTMLNYGMRVWVSGYDLPTTRLAFTRMAGLPDDATQAAWLDWHLQELHEVADQGRKLLMIVNLTELTGAMNAHQRKRQAEWNQRHDATVRGVMVGTSYITTSPIVRGVITAVLWLKPPPGSHKVVAQLDDALDWACEQCAMAGDPATLAMQHEVRETFSRDARELLRDRATA